MTKGQLKEIIKECIKEVLNESTFTSRDLEDHFYKNKKEIVKNMKTYGFKLNDLKSLRNYYDLANILGIDSRLLKDVDVQYYSKDLYDFFK